MLTYLVTWEIGPEEHPDPIAAARHAWDTMQRPGSTANVFKVIDDAGNSTTVDLQEIDEATAEATEPTTTKHRVLMQEATYYEIDVECGPGENPADAAEEAFVQGNYRVTGSGERSVTFVENLEETDG